jgi:hypothetical protein
MMFQIFLPSTVKQGKLSHALVTTCAMSRYRDCDKQTPLRLAFLGKTTIPDSLRTYKLSF